MLPWLRVDIPRDVSTLDLGKSWGVENLLKEEALDDIEHNDAGVKALPWQNRSARAAAPRLKADFVMITS